MRLIKKAIEVLKRYEILSQERWTVTSHKPPDLGLQYTSCILRNSKRIGCAIAQLKWYECKISLGLSKN